MQLQDCYRENKKLIFFLGGGGLFLDRGLSWWKTVCSLLHDLRCNNFLCCFVPTKSASVLVTIKAIDCTVSDEITTAFFKPL